MSSGFPYGKKHTASKGTCFTPESFVVLHTLQVMNCLGADQTSTIALASNLCMVLLGVKTHSAIASSKLYVCTERKMNSSLLVALNEMLLPP